MTLLRDGYVPHEQSYYNLSYNNLSSSFYDLHRVVVLFPRENAYGLPPSEENVFTIS